MHLNDSGSVKAKKDLKTNAGFNERLSALNVVLQKKFKDAAAGKGELDRLLGLVGSVDFHESDLDVLESKHINPEPEDSGDDNPEPEAKYEKSKPKGKDEK